MKFFNELFLRNLNFCVSPKYGFYNTRVSGMVDQYSAYVLMALDDIKSLKNNSDHLVKISIPKVAKNSQKVPIFAIFEILLATDDLCIFKKSLC